MLLFKQSSAFLCLGPTFPTHRTVDALIVMFGDNEATGSSRSVPEVGEDKKERRVGVLLLVCRLEGKLGHASDARNS